MKRASKVSWATLGVGEADSKKVLDLSINPPAPPPVQEEVTVVEETPAPVEQPAATDAPPVRPTGSTLKDRVSALADLVLDPMTSVEGRVKAARELLDLRRKKKQSWTKLGRSDLNDEYLRTIVNSHIDVAPPKEVSLPPAAEKAVRATKAAGKQAKANKAAKAAKAVAAPLPAPTGSRREQARIYFDRGDWVGLAALKKRAKLSWTALGFSNKEVDGIKLHLGEG